ncbi:DUF2474 family protein [uncultured Sulfitobacter sp.]|nr:DUF2474 family protein [uncultured Sulfitobacter sp.]
MPRSTLKKFAWFVAFWIVSVLALGIVAYVIRMAIKP